VRAPPETVARGDDDPDLMRAYLDAHGGDVAAATVDWKAIKREADEKLAYELEAAKNWKPKCELPDGATHIDAATFDQRVAKIDAPEKRAARARLRTPLRERSRNYGLAALDAEAHTVVSAPPGLRNETLNKAAWSLARLVRDGLLDPDDVKTVLTQAGIDAGLDHREAASTVRGALKRRNAR
jgi:hypothetical protein